MELLRSFHIDVEQGDLFCVLQGLDLLFSRAVIVRVDLEVLDELFSCDHLLEFLLGHEVVVFSVNFTLAGRTGRIRHGKAEFVRVLFGQLLDQGAFAGT